MDGDRAVIRSSGVEETGFGEAIEAGLAAWEPAMRERMERAAADAVAGALRGEEWRAERVERLELNLVHDAGVGGMERVSFAGQGQASRLRFPSIERVADITTNERFAARRLGMPIDEFHRRLHLLKRALAIPNDFDLGFGSDGTVFDDGVAIGNLYDEN